MALDTESFDLLLPTLQRFIQERLIPAEGHLEEHDVQLTGDEREVHYTGNAKKDLQVGQAVK